MRIDSPQDFKSATHTLILSDIHLSAAEKPHPTNRYWKLFKRPEHFVDDEFRKWLESTCAHIRQQEKGAAPSIELILNGDIFDFDSVMGVPPELATQCNWVERLRGMSAEEPKSVHKMNRILRDHPVWMDALRAFLLQGNRVIFVIGNHDMELHWPSVRQAFFEVLGQSLAPSVRFCEWFYLSNQDTLIEHGNQYDSYCLCQNPIHPLIKKGSRIVVRLPFGNQAGKLILNGMGLMNPHADSSFIKSSLWEYVQFYLKYVMRTQPLLLWTWMWSALVTAIYCVTEGVLPAMKDPLTLDARVEDIASRANASPSLVRTLTELHVHPAVLNPISILRELWLDRAILFALILLGSFQFFSTLNVFVNVSIWWFVFFFALFLPALIFYARSIESELERNYGTALERVPWAANVSRVKRIVQGHTHLEMNREIQGVEYFNTGSWSPAYHDVECTQPYGRKCFVWIRPRPLPNVLTELPQLAQIEDRVAELFEWNNGEAILIPRESSSS